MRQSWIHGLLFSASIYGLTFGTALSQDDESRDLLVAIGECAELQDDQSTELIASCLNRIALSAVNTRNRLIVAQEQLGNAIERVAGLETEMAAVQGRASSLHEELGSLQGLVAAFAAPAGCPPRRWRELEELRGRFIVGAGQGDGLTNRPFGTSGGEEAVRLMEAHMPSHFHNVHRTMNADINDNMVQGQGQDSRDEGEQSGIPTTSRGGDQPHNNMPPYIALHFCEYVGVDGGSQ